MKTDELICMMAKTPPCSCTKRNVAIWAAVAALFAVFSGIVVAFMGLRADIAGIMRSDLMLFKYAFLIAAVVGSGIAWWCSGHPGRNYKIAARGLIFLVALLAATALGAVFLTPMEKLPALVFDRTALICIGFIALYTVAGSFALAAVSQCMAPTNCRRHALFTIFFAGALGALAYALHCPNDHPDYLALWYVGTVLVVGFMLLPFVMKKQSW